MLENDKVSVKQIFNRYYICLICTFHFQAANEEAVQNVIFI